MRIIVLAPFELPLDSFPHHLEVAKQFPYDGIDNCDALVTSTAFCEEYGWHSGIQSAEFQTMPVFPNNEAELYWGVLADFFIANLNWKTEPPLMESTERRLQALSNTLQEMVSNNLLTRQIAVIDIGSLLPLVNSPDEAGQATRFFENWVSEISRLILESRV